MNEYFPKLKSLAANLKIECKKSRFKKCNWCWHISSRQYKKIDSANSKSDLDELDIDIMENLPTNLNNLKSKVDKLDVDKFKETERVSKKWCC